MIRVSSFTTPSLIGTLKSTRRKTRRPESVRSRMLRGRAAIGRLLGSVVSSRSNRDGPAPRGEDRFYSRSVKSSPLGTRVVPISAGPGRLRLLDQRRLPREESWIDCRSADDAAGAIRSLAVRGAPLIGVAAAWGLALEARRLARSAGFEAAWEEAASPPRCGPADGGEPRRRRRRMRTAFRASAGGAPGARVALLEAEAERFEAEDRAACEAMARHGADWLARRLGGEPGAPLTLLTHCNAGALATAGIGTALGVVRALAAERPVTRLRRRDPPLLAGSPTDRLGAGRGRNRRHDPPRRRGGVADRLRARLGRDRRRRPDRGERRRREQGRDLRGRPRLPRARRPVRRRRAPHDAGPRLSVGRDDPDRMAGRDRGPPPRSRRRQPVLGRPGGRAGPLPGLRRHPGDSRRRHRDGSRSLRSAARRGARPPPGPAVSLVLGLETSCDETSVALLREDGAIAASVVSSQIDMHRRYGGVVPEIAARAHLTNLPPLLDEALERAGARLEDVGLVVATAGPGLVGALLVGPRRGEGDRARPRRPVRPGPPHRRARALPVPGPRRGPGEGDPVPLRGARRLGRALPRLLVRPGGNLSPRQDAGRRRGRGLRQGGEDGGARVPRRARRRPPRPDGQGRRSRSPCRASREARSTSPSRA